jgi:signal transduction histidine kinase
VRSGVHEALDELREVITLLRDDEPGYETRPQPVLADLPRLIDESTAAGAEVRLRDDVRDPEALPAAAARTAYRVVQEGLTNARKHATGRPVRVTVGGEPGARLEIDIRNPLPPDGSGPSVPGAGTGLVGLTERVRLAGGELDHRKSDGEFRLHAWIPWPV